MVRLALEFANRTAILARPISAVNARCGLAAPKTTYNPNLALDIQDNIIYKSYIRTTYTVRLRTLMVNTKVRAYSATDRDIAMLEAIARYHGTNKSATIVSLVRREFWRVFPGGTARIKPDRGAKVEEK
jgi:hypothetical protein